MLILFFVALGLLASGLFWIGPFLQSSVSPEAANTFYILLRVVILLGFNFAAVRRFGRTAYQSLSTSGLIMFIDQVGFRSIWILTHQSMNSPEWVEGGLSSELFGNAFSYIVFLPLILLISFGGVAAGTFIRPGGIRKT